MLDLSSFCMSQFSSKLGTTEHQTAVAWAFPACVSGAWSVWFWRRCCYSEARVCWASTEEPLYKIRVCSLSALDARSQ